MKFPIITRSTLYKQTSPYPWLAVLVMLAGPLPAVAALSLAEQRLTDELRASVSPAESAVMLGEPEQPFLGLFAEAQTKKAKGGIILLHAWNAHADWPEVIGPLRRDLTRYGWHTLSIQLPLTTTPTATMTAAQLAELQLDIQQRIQVAIEYCRSRRIFNLVLLGHQFGAIAAGRFVSEPANANALSALVALNLFSPVDFPANPATDDNDWITQIKTAFLDIVPAQSPEHILQLANERKTTMLKLGHDKYRQIHIIGSDYSFAGSEHSLLTRIQAWLTRLAPSMEVPVAPTGLAPAGAAKR